MSIDHERKSFHGRGSFKENTMRIKIRAISTTTNEELWATLRSNGTLSVQKAYNKGTRNDHDYNATQEEIEMVESMIDGAQVAGWDVIRIQG